jgi:hypothetical protein
VRKSPRFAVGVEQVSAALARFAGRLLYARVDVAPDAAGNPQVMALELVEPLLFLPQAPAAL